MQELNQWDAHQIASFKKLLGDMDKVAKMSDSQISTAVINKVWAEIPMDSFEDLVLSEMVSRFEKMAGIKRAENGEVIT